MGAKHGRVFIEGNLIENIAQLTQPVAGTRGDEEMPRFLVRDVAIALGSMLPMTRSWLEKPTKPHIRTSLSAIARLLGSARAGKQLDKIRRALEILRDRELKFERFLVFVGPKTKKEVKISFSFISELNLSPEVRRPERTVAITLEDRILQNLRWRYVKSMSTVDFRNVRHATPRLNRRALSLLLFLEKRNQEFFEDSLVNVALKYGARAKRPRDLRYRVAADLAALQGTGAVRSYAIDRKSHRVSVHLTRA